MNLFLDDFRTPDIAANYMHPDIAVQYRTQQWDVVKSYKEFCSYITKYGMPEIISYDHDLDDEHYQVPNEPGFDWNEYYSRPDREMTGYDCAKWVVDYCIDNKVKSPAFIVHSMNGVGAENITHYLNNYKKHEKNLSDRSGTSSR